MLLASTYVVAVSRLLEGTENEVTPAVRREAFRALKHGIDHHATGVSLDGLDHVEKLLIQNLRDPDRSVRLSAG